MPRSTQPPEPIALLEWGQFKLAMLSNAAYVRVAERTTNQRSVSRIENYFTAEIENWPVAAMLWEQMIAGCIEGIGPTPEEAAGWTAIAQASNMPIEFTSDGYLVAVEQA